MVTAFFRILVGGKALLGKPQEVSGSRVIHAMADYAKSKGIQYKS